MKKSLLLVGCGGHARSIIDVVESTELWHVFGLVGLPNEVGGSILGYPILGSDVDLPGLRSRCASAFCVLGHIGFSSTRRRVISKLVNLQFNLPSLISSHAKVSAHSTIGPGTSVGHGAVVNAGAKIGSHCILNSLSLVEHDSTIGDYCHISTGAIINGGVRVGSGSFIGSRAMLREGLDLPDNTIISAGKRIMGWPLCH